MLATSFFSRLLLGVSLGICAEGARIAVEDVYETTEGELTEETEETGVADLEDNTAVENELVEEDFLDSYTKINWGWKPSGQTSIYMTPTFQIFKTTNLPHAFGSGETTTDTAASWDSSNHSRKVAANMNAEAEGQGWGFAFAASAKASLSSTSSESTRSYRVEKISLTMSKHYSHQLTTHQLAKQKLKQSVKNDFMRKSVDYIYSEYGAFYATRVDMGGLVKVVSTREVRAKEIERKVETEMQGSVESLMGPKGKVGAGGESVETANEKSGQVHTKVTARGGNHALWLAGTADYSATHKQWADSIVDGTEGIIKVYPQPLWRLIEAVAGSQKSKEFKEHCQGIWDSSVSDIESMGQSFAPEFQRPSNTHGDRLLSHPTGMLPSGGCLESNNGEVRLCMEGDGNLVIRKNGKAKWSSGTRHHRNEGAVLYFQNGNQLVVRRTNGEGIWFGKKTDGATHAVISNECRFIMYRTGKNGHVWQTGKRC